MGTRRRCSSQVNFYSYSPISQITICVKGLYNLYSIRHPLSIDPIDPRLGEGKEEKKNYQGGKMDGWPTPPPLHLGDLEEGRPHKHMRCKRSILTDGDTNTWRRHLVLTPSNLEQVYLILISYVHVFVLCLQQKISIPRSENSSELQTFTFYLSNVGRDNPQGSFDCIQQYITRWKQTLDLTHFHSSLYYQTCSSFFFFRNTNWLIVIMTNLY